MIWYWLVGVGFLLIFGIALFGFAGNARHIGAHRMLPGEELAIDMRPGRFDKKMLEIGS
jgi:hypothetical protein